MHRSAPIRDIIVHGVIGGLIAGLVVSLWFLGIDLIEGHPFATPAVLGQIVMQLPEFAMTPRLMLGYTALHFGVFILLGVAAIWVLRLTNLAPSLLLGLAFGVVTLDIVYYGALLVTGGSVMEVVAWYQVVPANAFAGMALMSYFHRAFHHHQPLGLGVLRGHPRLVEGIVTGLVGAGAVALWFLLVDLVSGRPLHTPAAIGSALFLGAQSDADIRLSLGLIAGYTMLHVAFFVCAGLAIAGAAAYLERTPSRVLVVGLALILLESVILATLVLSAEWVLGSVGLWAITAANVIAVGAMGWYAWRSHPALSDRLEHAPVDV